MAEEKKIATGYIGNALRSAADNHTTTFADEIFDTERQKYQNEVTAELEQAITDEVARAQEAELANTTTIEAETARAKAAEEANTQSIDTLKGRTNKISMVATEDENDEIIIKDNSYCLLFD